MSDPREDAINAAVNALLSEANYNPNFAPLAERNAMDTRLFLRRYDALMEWQKQQLTAEAEALIDEPKYARVECMFMYCPSVGLCQQDHRCRSPAKQGA